MAQVTWIVNEDDNNLFLSVFINGELTHFDCYLPGESEEDPTDSDKWLCGQSLFFDILLLEDGFDIRPAVEKNIWKKLLPLEDREKLQVGSLPTIAVGSGTLGENGSTEYFPGAMKKAGMIEFEEYLRDYDLI